MKEILENWIKPYLKCKLKEQKTMKKETYQKIYNCGAWFFLVPFILAIICSITSFFFLGTTTWAILMIGWVVFMIIGFINASLANKAIWRR